MKAIFFALVALSVIGMTASQMVGGYTEVGQTQLSALQGEQSFLRSVQAARRAYKEQFQQELGQIHKVYEQVVAGMNYRFIFEGSNGLVEVRVFCQPWTDTYQVDEIKHNVERN